MEWWHYLIVVVVWVVIVLTIGMIAEDTADSSGTYRNGILTFILLFLLLITFKYLFIE